METRLRICLRSLDLYSAWYPEFDALEALARAHGGSKGGTREAEFAS